MVATGAIMWLSPGRAFDLPFDGDPDAVRAALRTAQDQHLLDTNIASYIIKGNVAHVRERLVKVPMAEVGISVVTEAELRFGVLRKPGAERLKLAVDEFLLRIGLPKEAST